MPTSAARPPATAAAAASANRLADAIGPSSGYAALSGSVRRPIEPARDIEDDELGISSISLSLSRC